MSIKTHKTISGKGPGSGDGREPADVPPMGRAPGGSGSGSKVVPIKLRLDW